MPSAKTAISLPPTLLAEASRWARKLRLPRSRVIAQAMNEYFRRLESREIQSRMDEGNEAGLSEEDRGMLVAMRRVQARLLEDDKW